MSDRLLYEDKLLLASLLTGPADDRDCHPHRVLVNRGLARRIDIGQIELTDRGRVVALALSSRQQGCE